MQVMVIGGGISGLAMAMSLNQIGVPVRVYEAARSVTPLGVGINLQPNAVRELEELGLGERLAGLGTATQALCFFNKFGKLVWEEKRGRAAGFNWPQYSIHRGKLQVMLAEATRARIGDENLRTGHQLQRFEQRGDKVVAWFIDRRTRETMASDEADILIGADGIHSAVRRQLYPPKASLISPGRFCGARRCRPSRSWAAPPWSSPGISTSASSPIRSVPPPAAAASCSPTGSRK